MVVLQPEIVPLDQSQELANLIGLGFSAYLLQIDQFGDGGMGKDVMTAADPLEFKAKCLDKCSHVVKGNVVEVPFTESSEYLSEIHGHRMGVGTRPYRHRPFCSALPRKAGVRNRTV
jgi:hypothetical protein